MKLLEIFVLIADIYSNEKFGNIRINCWYIYIYIYSNETFTLIADDIYVLNIWINKEKKPLKIVLIVVTLYLDGVLMVKNKRKFEKS